MRVIVSDSSALIDLAKANLIEAAFSLPFEFKVPDVLLADELIDLGPYTVDKLLATGLVAGSLDGTGVEKALAYAARYPALSINDCFALELAHSGGDVLLTGDQNLRKAAVAEEIAVHGVIWLCDRMVDHGTVESDQLRSALEVWDADPSVWLPRHELQLRIRRLR